ncbi:hypothetical protein T440DRAFT_46390 [Plenodomus tracheiphilus IPT5]|uniref:DUF1996 domain-containing protein n=1 Tax=Plenodomus tracheiphilus IPT5 TaxID=1408161 RepID=A0A6A7BAW6_9PLEO|nr:hypothetical protein T440DRAFT_46390 [Plenodomus tracheiphilus IPT5]
MLRKSDCTSCQFGDDKSAYWTPSLHFAHENGKTEIVPQVGGMLAYYLLLGEDIKAFPKDFQMLAGDSRLRNFTGPVPDPPTSSWTADDMTQLALGQKAIGMNCLNYNKAPEGSRYRHFLPTKDYMDDNCANGIRAEIMFPSCWNGKDVTSEDHKSHVAYPSLIDGGNCPDDFPVRLPSLFYETIWNTYAFKGEAGQFVWSNGDPTGYGYHADFINGWNIDTLQSAVDTCTNPSGRVEDCPIFASNLQSEFKQAQCKIQEIPSMLDDDNCAGPANGLCGNVPVQYGPEYAAPLKPGAGGAEPSAKPSLSSAAPVPTQSYAPARSEGAGGISVYNVKPSAPANDNAYQAVAAAVSAVLPAAVTPAADIKDAAPAKDDGILSTTTYTKDGVVYEVCIKEVEITVTVSADEPEATPANYRRHVHRHRRDREHGLLGRQ